MRSVFFDLITIHDISNPLWFDYNNNYDVTEPKLAPYIYGLTLHLNGIKNIDSYFKSIQFNDQMINQSPWWIYYWNKSLLNSSSQQIMPIFKVIWANRITSILFMLGSFVLIYLFTLNLPDHTNGIFSLLLITSNYLLFHEGRLATADSMQLFFFSLSLLLLCQWQKSLHATQHQKLYLFSIAIGISSALAMSVKTSGALIPLYILLFFCINLRNSIRIHKFFPLGISFLIIMTTNTALFYILHPFVYQHPLEGIWKMYYERTVTYNRYWAIYPGSAVKNHKSALTAIYTNTLAPHGTFVNFPHPIVPIDMIVVVLGLTVLLCELFTTKNQDHKTSITIVTIWCLFTFISLIFYLKNNWSRYYVPLEVCICILQGYGINWLCVEVPKKIFFKLWTVG